MTSPEIYRKYITFKNKGETVLYVKALNYIYGIIKKALLFYNEVVVNINIIGFNITHMTHVPQKN